MKKNQENMSSTATSLRRKINKTLNTIIMRNIMGSITGVNTNQAVVSLTFDDGPHPVYTPRLIDILNKNDAKATFFVVGESAERYPEVVKYAISSGHVIANHTWDHPALPLITRRERIRQILSCEQSMLTNGYKLFRPPYGFQSIASYMDLKMLGYQIVTWNKSIEDWLDHDDEKLYNNLRNVLLPGCIVLMHDVLHHTIEDRYADRTPLINAIERILTEYSGLFSFVTIPELLRYGKIKKTAWFRAPDIEWLNSLNNGNTRKYK